MSFKNDSIVRSHIQEMPAYEPILPLDVLSKELGIPESRLVKLDANENPYGPLPEVFERLGKMPNLHIYPDPESRRIRRLMAAYHQVPDKSILVGAGADELIDLIMRIVIDPGDTLINCPPTFGMYAFDADLNKARIVSVLRRSDFSLDMSGIFRAVEKYQPKMLFLATPNNPDGGLVSTEQVKALLDLPILLVLDEAYINFAPQGASWINRVKDNHNLIVLRTFSKWAGLAGLRIGYGVFPEVFVPMLLKAKQPYNVSVAAEEAAIVSIQSVEKVEYNTQRTIKERERLLEQLREIPWLEPYPSQANFILCKVVGRPAPKVKQQLRAEGILIRFFNNIGLDDHIRISVGKPENTDQLIKALKRME